MNRRLRTALVIGAASLITAWFVAGVVLGAAAYLPGTGIQQYGLLRWSTLPGEAGRVTFRDVLPYFPYLRAPLFAGLICVAVFSADRRRQPLAPGAVKAHIALFSLSALPALLGGVVLVFTFLNAFVWRGLDGEYLNEFSPVDEAFFLAYALALLSYYRLPSLERDS